LSKDWLHKHLIIISSALLALLIALLAIVITLNSSDNNGGFTENIDDIDQYEVGQKAIIGLKSSATCKGEQVLSRNKLKVRVSGLSFDNSITPNMYRSLRTSFYVDIKNGGGKELIAVTSYYIEKCPMSPVIDYYSFNGVCASVSSLDSSQSRQQVTSIIPFCALEYSPNDFKYLYADVSIYEKNDSHYDLVCKSKRKHFYKPDAYIMNTRVEYNYEFEGKIYLAFHLTFEVAGRKGEQGLCAVSFWDENFNSYKAPSTSKNYNIDGSLASCNIVSFDYKRTIFNDHIVLIEQDVVREALHNHSILNNSSRKTDPVEMWAIISLINKNNEDMISSHPMQITF